MDDHTAPAGTATVTGVPERRGCTRCDGEQFLVGVGGGMGKYRCEQCELAVGFDLQASPVEFLISRGRPDRYTKDVFGSALLGSERRLSS